ncbi:hypothetical protein SAMN05444355_11410 [Flavobacterium frigoris]|uniref:Uncharacterized protein n=1 Tax=Flavobacterium frigoris TaxID=229204 RepID=A0A1H9PQ73_FLAFI|nr:hypothetical protein SAMN05444355_11410 [Flavobacterium frigoris]
MFMLALKGKICFIEIRFRYKLLSDYIEQLKS